VPQVIRGFDRFWRSTEYKRRIPGFRQVEASRLISLLSTRESLVRGNYERDENLGRSRDRDHTERSISLDVYVTFTVIGDGFLEALAVDHGTVSYNLRFWDPLVFRWFKERLSMNHRLATAGFAMGLERYLNAEPSRREMGVHIFPFLPIKSQRLACLAAISG
jgi:hypothetical protein